MLDFAILQGLTQGSCSFEVLCTVLLVPYRCELLWRTSASLIERIRSHLRKLYIIVPEGILRALLLDDLVLLVLQEQLKESLHKGDVQQSPTHR